MLLQLAMSNLDSPAVLPSGVICTVIDAALRQMLVVRQTISATYRMNKLMDCSTIQARPQLRNYLQLTARPRILPAKKGILPPALSQQTFTTLLVQNNFM